MSHISKKNLGTFKSYRDFSVETTSSGTREYLGYMLNLKHRIPSLLQEKTTVTWDIFGRLLVKKNTYDEETSEKSTYIHSP